MLARIISATCCSMGLAEVGVSVTCPAVADQDFGDGAPDAVVADDDLVARRHGVFERHGFGVVVVETAF